MNNKDQITNRGGLISRTGLVVYMVLYLVAVLLLAITSAYHESKMNFALIHVGNPLVEGLVYLLSIIGIILALVTLFITRYQKLAFSLIILCIAGALLFQSVASFFKPLGRYICNNVVYSMYCINIKTEQP
jgi:hypothetical protein